MDDFDAEGFLTAARGAFPSFYRNASTADVLLLESLISDNFG